MGWAGSFMYFDCIWLRLYVEAFQEAWLCLATKGTFITVDKGLYKYLLEVFNSAEMLFILWGLLGSRLDQFLCSPSSLHSPLLSLSPPLFLLCFIWCVLVLSVSSTQRRVGCRQDRKHQKGHPVPGPRRLVTQRTQRPQHSCECFHSLLPCSLTELLLLNPPMCPCWTQRQRLYHSVYSTDFETICSSLMTPDANG